MGKGVTPRRAEDAESVEGDGEAVSLPSRLRSVGELREFPQQGLGRSPG